MRAVKIAIVVVVTALVGTLMYVSDMRQATATTFTVSDDNTGTTAADVILSVSATVRGRVRLDYTCDDTELVSSLGGSISSASETLTIAFSDVDSGPADDFTGTLRTTRNETDGGGYYFIDCDVFTRLAGSGVATYTIQAGSSGVTGSMEPFFAAEDALTTGFEGADAYAVTGTTADIIPGAGTFDESPGLGSVTQDLWFGIFVDDTVADSTAQSATVTITLGP